MLLGSIRIGKIGRLKSRIFRLQDDIAEIKRSFIDFENETGPIIDSAKWKIQGKEEEILRLQQELLRTI
jgi:hypothetical protein